MTMTREEFHKNVNPGDTLVFTGTSSMRDAPDFENQKVVKTFQEYEKCHWQVHNRGCNHCRGKIRFAEDKKGRWSGDGILGGCRTHNGLVYFEKEKLLEEELFEI